MSYIIPKAWPSERHAVGRDVETRWIKAYYGSRGRARRGSAVRIEHRVLSYQTSAETVQSVGQVLSGRLDIAAIRLEGSVRRIAFLLPPPSMSGKIKALNHSVVLPMNDRVRAGESVESQHSPCRPDIGVDRSVTETGRHGRCTIR